MPIRYNPVSIFKRVLSCHFTMWELCVKKFRPIQNADPTNSLVFPHRQQFLYSYLRRSRHIQRPVVRPRVDFDTPKRCVARDAGLGTCGGGVLDGWLVEGWKAITRSSFDPLSLLRSHLFSIIHQPASKSPAPAPLIFQPPFPKSKSSSSLTIGAFYLLLVPIHHLNCPSHSIPLQILELGCVDM